MHFLNTWYAKYEYINKKVNDPRLLIVHSLQFLEKLQVNDAPRPCVIQLFLHVVNDAIDDLSFVNYGLRLKKVLCRVYSLVFSNKEKKHI